MGILSKLVMLGDLNNDKKWTKDDQAILAAYMENPNHFPASTAFKTDLNRNGLFDREDIYFLEKLYTSSNISDLYSISHKSKETYPKPRELFVYIGENEYLQHPLFTLSHCALSDSELSFLISYRTDKKKKYNNLLFLEIYDEAIRGAIVYSQHKASFTDFEREYYSSQIEHLRKTYQEKNHYNLLLQLISFTEDLETVHFNLIDQSNLKLIHLRNHLRELLTSDKYLKYTKGALSEDEMFLEIEHLIKQDLNMKIQLKELEPPRDFTKLSNYFQRSKWQYHKSMTSRAEMTELILYAQKDRRYLRAVCNTSEKNQDLTLENHNLPMRLLFRKALEISNNNKADCIGMLDEAIRLPFAWVKSIPDSKRPSSVALENFLLPGNKEDGSDKSRHWNVFGGLALYKSPEESIKLALQREVQDLKKTNHPPQAMTEFIRDTIANINGIFYVPAIQNPPVATTLSINNK